MKERIIIFLFLLSAVVLNAQPSYKIYPIPHKQIVGGQKVSFTTSVNIVAEGHIDAATLNRAKQILTDYGLNPVVSLKPAKDLSNILLGTVASGGVADKQAKKLGLSRDVFSLPKYDKHLLNLYADKSEHAQVLILGENTDAVFCGLASLEQILDVGIAELPVVTLYDYADLKNLGVMEGYYGVPYSAEVTKDLFRFMARYKMNTYMYGAKSDPYHSQFWSQPYPTSITPEQKRIGYLTQDMLRELTSMSHASKVNFIWAIHPGTAFTDSANTEVLGQIMDKFSSMYDLGVRQFGVFVDDVGVPEDDASLKLDADRLTELQRRIDARWNGPAALPADTVKPLHYVPQLYAFSWVSREKGRQFFQSLADVPEKVNIYITGRKIWSVPNSRDLEIVREWIGHSPSWWWNYPCNDNDVTKLFPMDMYTNFRDEKHIANLARLEPNLRGTGTIILNPMQQGEVSKIALFSAADYTWNNVAFDNQQSFEASLVAVAGAKRAGALRKVAPYLRYYDTDALLYLVNDYKTYRKDDVAVTQVLLKELKEVNGACKVLEELQNSSSETDRLLYDDLRPWLLKLDVMTQEAIDLMEGRTPIDTDYENDPRFQFEILTGLGADIDLSVKTAEPAAEVLLPFLQWLRDDCRNR